MATKERALEYSYAFKVKDGRTKDFTVKLDPETLDLIPSDRKAKPSWTALDFHQCPNCPLDLATHPHCPVAASMVEAIDFFRSFKSYEEVDVRVDSPDRTYVKNTSLHEALSSLVGIYMVTAGCPVMQKLKPMVRFHLPFASEDETKYRVMSMYLMAQYFIFSQGGTPDWQMKNLIDIYDDVREVNRGFAQRLANIHVEDASLNALINLDCFAMSVSFSLNLQLLEELEIIFKGYLE